MAAYDKDIPKDERCNISEFDVICGDDILKTSPRLLGYRNYSANDLEKALQAKTAGASASELSIKYNIPERTIYRKHKKTALTMNTGDQTTESSITQSRSYKNYSLNDLEKAVQARTAGASLNELSKTYNIPKYTIYHHHKKSILMMNTGDKTAESDRAQLCLSRNKKYSANDLEKAVQARVAGAPVSMLSSMYNVPTATIYQHHKKNILTMNTSDQTAESSITQPRSYKNYSANDLKNAVQARNAGTSLIAVSSRYNIPQSTIKYHQKKNFVTRNAKDITARKS